MVRFGRPAYEDFNKKENIKMVNKIIGNFVDLKETDKVIKLIVVNTEGEYEEVLGLKRYGWTTDGFENIDEYSLSIEYSLGNNGAKWLKDVEPCERVEITPKEPYVDNSKPKAETKVAEGVVTKVEQKGRTYRVTIRYVNGFKKMDTLFITTKYIDVPEGVKVHIEYTESVSEFRGKEQTSRWIQNIEVLSEKVVVGSHFEIDTKDEIGELLEQFLIENDIHYTKEDKVEYATDRSDRRF